jgi:hypothetical protein
MADLNEYTPAFFERTLVGPRPEFNEVVAAGIDYDFAPIVDTVRNRYLFADQRDPNYKALDDIEGYEIYAADLALAKNSQHMAALKKAIDESISRRQTLSEATIGSQLVAGMFNPINLVALPFGGPVVGIGRSAVRVGGGTVAIQLGLEATNQEFDPIRTYEESAMNVVTAGLFGAGTGAVFGGLKVRAYNRTKDALTAEFDAIRRIENLGGLTREDIANTAPRNERGFGELDDQTINENVARLNREADQLEADAEAGALGNNVRERASELRAEAQKYSNELGLRSLEDMRVDLKDPYNIAPSLFTDSPLFKMVSTPMKRALQSKYPSAVKEKFVQSFGDSGITLVLNSIGLPSPQSVFQRTAVSNGRWVVAHDQLIKLWASDTSAAQITPLDLNLVEVGRRVQRKENTYRNWLKSVNEKRIKNQADMTESELKAVSVINKYFADAEKRLEEVGLIGTEKGMKNRISAMGKELELLRNEFAGIETQTTAKAQREQAILRGRIKQLEARVQEETDQLSALAEFNVNPEREDVFFPRFWDQGAIRKNRNEFADILYKWYEQNPRVFDYDAQARRYVEKELSTAPAAIQERVDQTIARILNEADPTNVDTIAFGHGRSKHFRHRQVDIPNKMVTKFMVTDPLAAMKTYAARIEPRYEYAKAFGKDIDGVLLDMERAMIRDGASDVEINKMRRDYLHMYDRVAGAIIRSPDSWDQKIGFALREFASFSYMGSAGLAALPDFGRIVMEYDLENVMRGIQGIADRNTVNLTVDEVRIAGEAIDILKGSAHMRMVEDLSNNVDANDLLSTARNAFYVVNGLAPLTTIAKQLAGVIDAHTIIDYSVKLTRGELDDQSRTWLARYGIGPEEAARIARAPWQRSNNGLIYANTEAWADNIFIPEIEGRRVNIIEMNDDGTPVGKQRGDRYIPAFYDPKTNTIRFDREYIEGVQFNEQAWLNPKVEGVDALPDIFKTPKQWSNFVMLHEIMHTRMSAESLGFDRAIPAQKAAYENRINQMALEEYRAQQTLNEETVLNFRSALNSGVLNTIMSGTPADKPIITDGVAYIPMRVARQFGMKEDARYRGYARVENGLLGLPFQFYSYTLANVNKTVGALAHGQVKNRMIGVATMMGLAYMSLKLRTRDYVWEDMSWQDRFARSFDMSGVMALYSDIFYTSMHTSLALGGPNITGGLLSPKFPQQPSMLDAVTGIAGAGPSWLADTASGIYQFADGEYGEGAKQIVRNAPFARLWFLKSDVNQITHAWAN